MIPASRATEDRLYHHPPEQQYVAAVADASSLTAEALIEIAAFSDIIRHRRHAFWHRREPKIGVYFHRGAFSSGFNTILRLFTYAASLPVRSLSLFDYFSPAL